MKECKREYIEKEFAESKNDEKRFWKRINYVMKGTQ